jgi:PIN domain nuclease of toxin-antitoxin system
VSHLLDTHAVIWLTGGKRLNPRVVETLGESQGPVYVSAVSAFEVSTKVRLGKLDRARALADGWDSAITELGATALALTDRHALVAARLDWAHRDPFDRLLAAQAVSDKLTFVTADPVFAGLPGLDLLTW